jgi:hypothetical protein
MTPRFPQMRQDAQVSLRAFLPNAAQVIPR